VVDSTTITAVTPAHPAGAATVTVTTNGTTLPLATPFTYGGTNPIPPVQPPGPVIPGVVPDPVPGTRPGAVPPPSGGQPPAPLPPKR
jgi:hypothetical protein